MPFHSLWLLITVEFHVIFRTMMNRADRLSGIVTLSTSHPKQFFYRRIFIEKIHKKLQFCLPLRQFLPAIMATLKFSHDQQIFLKLFFIIIACRTNTHFGLFFLQQCNVAYFRKLPGRMQVSMKSEEFVHHRKKILLAECKQVDFFTNRRPLNVLVIGPPGCGKSSFLNTVFASFNDDKWREIARTGRFSNNRQVTRLFKRYTCKQF